MSIKLERVSYIYKPNTPFETKALDDISLSIESGEYVGLIGHTGSGKSTLVQHLNGLLKASQGTVTVDGIVIGTDRKMLKAIRQRVGLVFQYPEHQLFEETVYKDVAFGPKHLNISEAEIEQRVRESLEAVGLDPNAIGQWSPFELSGGQRRRIAIAGVLAMRPQVLVLDEPTAGLDPRGRKVLLSQIAALNQRGMTVILISHSMEEIASNTRRILVMNRGRLVMDASPSEVFLRSEEIRAMGLSLPAVTELLLDLKQRGLSVSENVFDPETAGKSIADALRGRGL